jgi:hypothetical protein
VPPDSGTVTEDRLGSILLKKLAGFDAFLCRTFAKEGLGSDCFAWLPTSSAVSWLLAKPHDGSSSARNLREDGDLHRH